MLNLAHNHHRHRSATTVLLCLLCVSLLSAAVPSRPKRVRPQKKTEDKRVYLVHADELRYDRWQNNDAQVLSGHVEFRHNGARLLCDSANFFEASNSFEAFGHVKMYQGDTLSLFSDYGYYDGNDQMMQAINNVVLRHRGTRLYTDSLYYDRLWNMGYFEEGGKLVDKSTTLVSDWGEYHTDRKLAIFYYDVKMTDKRFQLTTDSLYYDTRLSMAHIVGPSDIVSGRSHIYSEMGYYDTRSEQSRLLHQSVLTNGGKRLVGDSIWHDGKAGISKGYGHVVYTDSVNRNMLLCNYGYYDDSLGYAMCTDSAVAIDFSQRDSLYVHADTFKVFTFNHETDSVYRVIHAFHGVRAYRRDVQAVCDSLVYNSKDSCMTLYHDPICWNVNQQLVGDRIDIFMRDSVIDHAHVIDNAFSIEQLREPELFNQVSSKEMFAYFVKGEISEACAENNVVVSYYPEDTSDSVYILNVYLETSKLRMFLEQRKLKSIWTPKSEGVAYPINQIPRERRRLPGFAWYDYVRPLSRDDIFRYQSK